MNDNNAVAISPSFDENEVISLINDVSYFPSTNLVSFNAEMWNGMVDGIPEILKEMSGFSSFLSLPSGYLQVI